MIKSNVDDIVSEYKKIYHGNSMRAMWNLLDLMKNCYEQTDIEDGRLYYESIISMLKDELASE